MKEKYEQYLEDKNETRLIDAGDKVIEVQFTHYPNVTGRRSKFTGLPIWVGKTVAKTENMETTALCWVKEPFTYERGRYVSAGRLLKMMGLPTKLAEQVRE